MQGLFPALFPALHPSAGRRAALAHTLTQVVSVSGVCVLLALVKVSFTALLHRSYLVLLAGLQLRGTALKHCFAVLRGTALKHCFEALHAEHCYA
jgi:hypothetical protein